MLSQESSAFDMNTVVCVLDQIMMLIASLVTLLSGIHYIVNNLKLLNRD
ncbi:MULTISPECIES: hypothetical protein [unclassified Paenibacillus]|uniref:Uncharacterized protein n=1 Tax=Paenibacillus provencensis TaxID=441151 RepID=A0ABW3PW47_9BACL|nr:MULTISPECIES: hypothetical protein [unclassified Paenibacillus]